jgi:Clp amino terminal domain, pathogenicity island component
VAGKLDSSAGAVIADALVRARAEGTGRIGEEHLFAALLASPDSGPLLGQLGPEQAEAMQSEVREARRRGGLTAGEEQALAGLGIDLDEVVARVEASWAREPSTAPGSRPGAAGGCRSRRRR